MSTLFKQRLHDALDELKVPPAPSERLKAFERIFVGIERDDARDLLNGKLPEPELLERLAAEFEMNAKYLSGASDLNK